MPEHISKQFDAELEAVRSRVLQMGGLVEEQIVKAVEGLASGDIEALDRVIEDDHRVNAMEVGRDESCSQIIARRQPAASDLRLVMAIIKTITDLERIGDEVEKVGNIAARLATMEKPADNYREIRHLGRLVTEMVHDALHAFARLDADEAFEVARRDRKVDEEYEAVQRQSITFMMEDPRSIRRALEIMWVVRALERIGDHAKNICEYTVYMVHGKDIRHLSIEDAERQIRDFASRDRKEA
jgi:phosphate transport system protein